ncbi:MAG TPA: peroxidase family protein [Thermoleophilaceae bacterium]|nr:peroxidase family protein [Thermoleophilaceae bacterium]
MGLAHHRTRLGRTMTIALAVTAVCATQTAYAAGPRTPRPDSLPPRLEPRALDGRGNNRAHPNWGQAGTSYVRVAPAAYGDGRDAQAGGVPPRYVSNRIFNDVGQNLFSDRRVTQWVWTWGQFMDHTFGLAEGGDERAPIAFDPADPLERFRNDLGVISFKRDSAVPGTGTSGANPRQQLNTVSSYIDGWSVYGGTRRRLEWLRTGPFDGRTANNGARLLTTAGGYLPTAAARGDSGSAPEMAAEGALAGHPQDAVVAGDVRANENIALTAVHTLFAREHNRIVDRLPRRLPAELRFQIARRIVGAEQQYVTYREFLPAVGVRLPPYGGYRPGVNPALGNEFATVGYRAHSMIHGEFELDVPADRFDGDGIDHLEAQGVDVEDEGGDELELKVPLAVAFFNPGLLPEVGLDSVAVGLASEAQYRNDEQMDDALRSVLFQIPGPVQGVTDLGALDVQRARDHGIPSYNRLRAAYGLAPKTSFRAITGESSEDASESIDDPAILDFLELRGPDGESIPFGTEEAEEGATEGTRRTTLAARLKGVYGSVDAVDAFTGMVSERHVPGTEFGELQLAMWRRQFQALRDGDRFFYAGDRALDAIARRYGVSYRHSLAELIALNTDVDAGELPADVFRLEGAPAE